MGEAIGRVIGWIFMSIVLAIFRVIGALFGFAIGAAKDKRLVSNARSGGAITRTPPGFEIKERFEHTHIVAGSGHGKTQLLQKMILEDIGELKQGKGSIVVIDSQGDMIKNIMHMADMKDLKGRLVLIDPNNIEYPPALNLFDFGLDRLSAYNLVERERILNGTVALYEYLFGALLGAELTMRQGVIFRYLARLMMTVPEATIHTMLKFIEEPDAVRPYLDRVDPMTKHFFESQFFSPAYKETRQQIEARLWGVFSNTVLARMFANPKNKLNIFEALNNGSLILINTAKDLLKQDGCQIMGRFFIALIGQAAQERAVIHEDKRRATFVYVDEAHDYFDDNLENLFNQLRKYKTGLVIAHQNLGQLSTKLKETVMASTSIKIVGGLSASDANAFAKEMRSNDNWLLSMQKQREYTTFAVYRRSASQYPPTDYKIPFGMIESRRKLTDEEYEELILENAARYSSHVPVLEKPAPAELEKPLIEPEML
jgi:hypothetical protein